MRVIVKPLTWRRVLNGGWAFAIAVVISACSGQRPTLPEKPRPSALTITPVVAASSSAPSPAPPPAPSRDPLLERHVTELARAVNDL